MFKNTHAFGSFSVDDLQKAKVFYGDTLGLEVKETPEGLSITISGGGSFFIYPKSDHEPATFTILNFPVDDIEKAVDKLAVTDIVFEQYGGDIKTDEKGIFWGAKQENMGPNIAWFKDPAENILSIIEDKR